MNVTHNRWRAGHYMAMLSLVDCLTPRHLTSVRHIVKGSGITRQPSTC